MSPSTPAATPLHRRRRLQPRLGPRHPGQARRRDRAGRHPAAERRGRTRRQDGLRRQQRVRRRVGHRRADQPRRPHHPDRSVPVRRGRHARRRVHLRHQRTVRRHGHRRRQRDGRRPGSGTEPVQRRDKPRRRPRLRHQPRPGHGHCHRHRDASGLLHRLRRAIRHRPVHRTGRGDAVYVANQGANTLSVIDPSTFKTTATIATGNSPYGIAVVQPWPTVSSRR